MEKPYKKSGFKKSIYKLTKQEFAEEIKKDCKILIRREIITHSEKARLFVLQTQDVNGKHVRGGVELWIPKSQILQERINGGETDYILTISDFYKTLTFV